MYVSTAHQEQHRKGEQPFHDALLAVVAAEGAEVSNAANMLPKSAIRQRVFGARR
jgi:hypothetical protein